MPLYFLPADSRLQVKHEVVDHGNHRAVIKGKRTYYVSDESQSKTEQEKAAKRYIHAHQSVRQDWTEHDDARPSDVRERVWTDPFYTPTSFISERERRFVQTRRIRRRTGQYEGYKRGEESRDTDSSDGKRGSGCAESSTVLR